MYIIADVGSNWEKEDDLFESVYYAKKAGANAVKFQFYDHEKLYGFKGDIPGVLTKQQIVQLHNKAKNCSIDFMVTPFHEDDIGFLNDYVQIWKIASSDNTYTRMLNRIANTEKPSIISTGSVGINDLGESISILQAKTKKVCVMYCVSAYPSREHDLTYLDHLRERFGKAVGFSDHSLDIYNAPWVAKNVFKCEFLEKHFKLREMDTPDSDHSLLWTDFKRMVDRLKVDTFRSWTENHSEHAMKQMHNRRLVATKMIHPGDKFVYGKNYGCFRVKSPDPCRIDAKNWHKIEGHSCRSIVAIGTSIQVHHVEEKNGTFY